VIAAARFGVTVAELGGWIAGEPPPEDLLRRLDVFTPQLRNAAFRLRVQAENKETLLEFFEAFGCEAGGGCRHPSTGTEDSWPSP
jgi:hypothetical protein